MVTIFDDEWFKKARARTDGDTWVDHVLGSIQTYGGAYLRTLVTWFNKFPLKGNKNRRTFKKRIESFANEDHLGAVNELSWWKFMDLMGLESSPLPPSRTPHPDFHVSSPPEFFCEVSTLNVSDKDKRSFRRFEGVDLDHGKTVKRILLKVAQEKHKQIAHGALKHAPTVLVLFDYTTWSGFATEFYRDLANFLLGPMCGFSQLPKELSALVYVERQVLNGQIVFSKHRSAVYYNPLGQHVLPLRTFPDLVQFAKSSNQIVEIRPNAMAEWLPL